MHKVTLLAKMLGPAIELEPIDLRSKRATAHTHTPLRYMKLTSSTDLFRYGVYNWARSHMMMTYSDTFLFMEAHPSDQDVHAVMWRGSVRLPSAAILLGYLRRLSLQVGCNDPC